MFGSNKNLVQKNFQVSLSLSLKVSKSSSIEGRLPPMVRHFLSRVFIVHQAKLYETWCETCAEKERKKIEDEDIEDVEKRKRIKSIHMKLRRS